MSNFKKLFLAYFVATNGVRGNNESISCSRENHTLKAARLLLFDLPLEKQ